MDKLIKKMELSSFQLKWIAIISMAVDHAGAILFPEILVLRYIGRIAFPIFCFLLVEGFFYTSNVKKYLLRLGVFTLVSEIPFDLAIFGEPFSWQHQNVFVTLFLGVLMLWLVGQCSNIFFKISIVILTMVVAELLHSDYGMGGILLIGGFYLFREKKIPKLVFGSIWSFFGGGYWKIQSFSIIALIPIALYNGKKGKSMKYFFYMFYPVHLLILYFIQWVMNR